MRRHLLVVLLLALTALVASCGDDNEDPVLDPPSLSTPSTAAPDVDTTGDDSSDEGDDPATDGDETDTDGVDPDDPAATSTTEPEDVVTTTSERLDPDDPNYPTLPPSPTVTYPETDGS